MASSINPAAAQTAAQTQAQQTHQQAPAAGQGLGGTPTTAHPAVPLAPPAQDGYCKTYFKTQLENISNFFGSIKDVFLNTLSLVWGVFTGCCKTSCSRAQAQPAPAQPVNNAQQAPAQPVTNAQQVPAQPVTNAQQASDMLEAPGSDTDGD